MDMMKKIPVREQDPAVRATNFEEVCLGYNKEEAEAEASRCLNCKNPMCVTGCPVEIDIPGFIAQVKAGDTIEIQFGSKNVKVEVLDIKETVRKEDAENLFRYR